MENTGVINVKLRTSTRKGDNNILKRDGYLLGNIAGKGVESVAIAIKKDEFRKSMKALGRNGVFKLVVPEGEEYTVMTKEMHITPIKNEIAHVDFQIVSLSEKLKQDVAIKIIGAEFFESKGLLINSVIDSILVEGLPQSIPDEIEINVSELEAGESVQISDVKLPEGIASITDPDQIVLSVIASKMHNVEEEETEEEVEAE